jgi:hypothetical protein
MALDRHRDCKAYVVLRDAHIYYYTSDSRERIIEPSAAEQEPDCEGRRGRMGRRIVSLMTPTDLQMQGQGGPKSVGKQGPVQMDWGPKGYLLRTVAILSCLHTLANSPSAQMEKSS